MLLESLLRVADEERAWAVASAGLGALAVLLALGCWLVWPRPLAQGAAVPLAILGAIFLVAGGADFVSSARERQALPERLREAPHLVAAEALPRARAAVDARGALRVADGLLVLLGLALLTRKGKLRGAGLGALVMGAVALGLDSQAVTRHLERVALLEQVVARYEGR